MDNQPSADKFEFYSTQDYFRHLADSISKTVKNDRVILSAMTFNSKDPLIAELMRQLISAAKRGVMTTIIIDSYTFTSNGLSKLIPFVFSTKQNHNHSPIVKALEELKNFGGRYAIINRPRNPFSLIYSGRFHAKLAVINNRVYVGGCNLSDTERIDMMVGWDDSATADKLSEICVKITEPNYRQTVFHGQDIKFELSKTMELIFDAGIKRQSSIMDVALSTIDNAEQSIFFACQYYPNSLTARRLIRAAERGVEVTILFNDPSQHSFPNNMIHRLVMLKQSWLTPNSLKLIELPKSERYLHAKLIATEKAAIVGSHNFIMAGVNFGTTEIALHVNSQLFASRAIKTITDQLSSVSDK